VRGMKSRPGQVNETLGKRAEQPVRIALQSWQSNRAVSDYNCCAVVLQTTLFDVKCHSGQMGIREKLWCGILS